MKKSHYVGRIIARNFKNILYKTIGISGTMYAIVSAILAFISWNEIGVTKVTPRLLILLGVLLLSFLGAIVWICFINSSKTVWEHGNASIKLMFGDIINLAFPAKKAKKNYAVVIPVNNDFDVSCQNGLIAPMSIHGQWIKKMLQAYRDEDTLNNRIRFSACEKLKLQGTPISRDEKPYGNTVRFPLGTVISVYERRSNITFYLLALTQLDKDLVAHCSWEECIFSLRSLIDFHNIHGQGSDLYIPLVGTGLSRLRLTHEDSVDMITSVCKLKQESIHYNIHIVIRNTERDHITLSDF